MQLQYTNYDNAHLLQLKKLRFLENKFKCLELIKFCIINFKIQL